MLDSLPVSAQSIYPIPNTTDEVSPGLVLQGYLRREQLAEQLEMATRTLDRLIAKGDGPPRVKIGRTFLYSIDSVRDWLKSREEKQKAIRNRPVFRRQAFAR